MLSFLKAIDGVDDHNNDNSENVEMKGGTGGGGGDSIGKYLQKRLNLCSLDSLQTHTHIACCSKRMDALITITATKISTVTIGEDYCRVC